MTKILRWSLSLWAVEVDWNRIIANGTNSVNKLFSSFYNKYNTIVNKHAPMKKLSNRKAKQLSKPWITDGIRAATKFNNKLYATGDKVRLKHYRNKICTVIHLSKRRYYDTFFENNMSNMTNLARNQWTFTSTEKKLKSHIRTKGF